MMKRVGGADDPSGIPSETVAGAIERSVPPIKSGLQQCFSLPLVPDSPVGTDYRRAQALHSEHMLVCHLEAVASCLAASVDGLAAVPALLRTTSPTVPIFAVGRAVTESAALAFWLLDPGIETLERLRRAANHQIDGYREMSRFIGEIQASVQRLIREVPKGPKTDPETEANIEDLLAWGATVGLEVQQGRLAQPEVLGRREDARRPAMMDLIDHVLGAGDDHHIPGLGQAYYRVASAVTHSNWHGRAVLGQSPDVSASDLFRAPSVETTAFIVPFAIDAFCAAAEAALKYFEADLLGAEAALQDLAAAVKD